MLTEDLPVVSKDQWAILIRLIVRSAWSGSATSHSFYFHGTRYVEVAGKTIAITGNSDGLRHYWIIQCPEWAVTMGSGEGQIKTDDMAAFERDLVAICLWG